jgi:hypothetical protein
MRVHRSRHPVVSAHRMRYTIPTRKSDCSAQLHMHARMCATRAYAAYGPVRHQSIIMPHVRHICRMQHVRQSKAAQEPKMLVFTVDHRTRHDRIPSPIKPHPTSPYS